METADADEEEEEKEDQNKRKTMKTEEEEEEEGGCRQQQRLYFDAVFACDVLVYIANLHSLFRSVQDSLIPPPPTTS